MGKLCRSSNCTLPSSSTSNSTENVLACHQTDWPSAQIPGPWEILTFGFLRFGMRAVISKLLTKEKFMGEKNKHQKKPPNLGVENNDSWHSKMKYVPLDVLLCSLAAACYGAAQRAKDGAGSADLIQVLQHYQVCSPVAASLRSLCPNSPPC